MISYSSVLLFIIRIVGCKTLLVVKLYIFSFTNIQQRVSQNNMVKGTIGQRGTPPFPIFLIQLKITEIGKQINSEKVGPHSSKTTKKKKKYSRVTNHLHNTHISRICEARKIIKRNRRQHFPRKN